MIHLSPVEQSLKDTIRAMNELKTTLEAQPVVEIVKCWECKHFHVNVRGEDIGIDLPLIVGHEACDAWGNDWVQTHAEGFCHLAERRTDG